MNAGHAEDSRIAQVLAGWGKLSHGQLQAAQQELARRRASGAPVRLGAILVEWGLVSERDIRQAHSQGSVPRPGDAATVDAGSRAHAPPPAEPLKIPRGLSPEDTEAVRAALSNPGAKRVGSYVVLRELGRGGMGVVLKAYDPKVERLVAIKQLIGMHEERHRRRFQREARLAGKLSHPGIATVYETGEASGAPFLAMQLVSGRSLEERCEAVEDERLDVDDAVRIVQGISEAMAYAHHERVLHRDLKPQNVLVTDDGAPVVVDFGLARELDTTTASLTKTGQILGTYLYMAPEQARGEKDTIGPATDVYALGAILYRCLTGQPPITGENALELVAKVLKLRPDPPSKLNPEVPKALDRICLQCLEKDPLHRYANAGGLAEDLARHLQGEEVTARVRRPKAAVLLAGALAALLLAGGAAAWALNDTPATPKPGVAPVLEPSPGPDSGTDPEPATPENQPEPEPPPKPEPQPLQFDEDFAGGLSQWRNAGEGTWTFVDGVGRFNGNSGNLIARGVELPDAYILQFDARVTEHNPRGNGTDHIIVVCHIDAEGKPGFSAGLRQNDPNPTVRGWLYSDPDGMRVGPYVMNDTLWHRFRLVKRAGSLEFFVSFDGSQVLQQVFDLAITNHVGGSFALTPSGGTYEFRDVSLRSLADKAPATKVQTDRRPLAIPVDGAWSQSSAGETTLSVESGSFSLSAGSRYGVITLARTLRLQAPCKALTTKIRDFTHSKFGHGEVHATLWIGDRKIAHYYVHLGEDKGAYKGKADEKGPSDSFQINTTPDGSYSLRIDFETDRPEAVDPADLLKADRLEVTIQADTWVAGSSVAFRIGELQAIPFD